MNMGQVFVHRFSLCRDIHPHSPLQDFEILMWWSDVQYDCLQPSLTPCQHVKVLIPGPLLMMPTFPSLACPNCRGLGFDPARSSNHPSRDDPSTEHQDTQDGQMSGRSMRSLVEILRQP